jgi:type 2 lantibiotic biosynthesis protein LanM
MAIDSAAQAFDGSLGCLSSSAVAALATQLGRIDGLGRGEAEAILKATRNSLQSVLHDKLVRLLVLELHAAREDGRLDASESEQRWEQFQALSSEKRYWGELNQQYPGLLKRIGAIVRNRCAASERFARRWVSDRSHLTSLGLDADDKLLSVTFGAGDSHRGGQTVAILICRGGRVAYKPRPVEVDAALGAFISELKADLASLSIRVPKVVAREDYGWAEFIEHKFAADEHELCGFYRGMGQWLAVMRLLGGTDLHTENLIAHRQSPVVIDCETLFTPKLPMPASGFGDALDRATELIGNTVMSIGLLPDRGVGLGWRGVDGSAVGSLPDQQPMLSLPGLLNAGTDQVRIGTVMVEAPKSKNHPSANPDLAKYWPEILGGFDETTACLQKIDAAGGLRSRLEKFEHCRIRGVPRATEVYAEVMRMLWHPVSLHDEAAARQRAQELLSKMAEKVPAAPSDPAVIASEIADMSEGDVPYFSTTPLQGSLEGPRGTHWRPDANLIDGALRHWRDADLELERHVIQAALVSAYVNQGWRPDEKPTLRPKQNRTGNIEARRRWQLTGIMRKLMETAIRGRDGSVAWIAPVFIPNIGWAIKALGPDLYGGTSGIALLLAAYLRESRAGRVDPIVGISGLFDGAMRTLELGETLRARQRKGNLTVRPILPGGYCGLGSMIWTRLILDAWGCGGNESLLRTCDIAKDIRTSAAVTDEHDVLSGTAGAIQPLLMLSERTGDEYFLQMARELGDQLCSQAIRKKGTAFWIHAKWPEGIGGFAHGVTGIGWALAKLAQATMESRYAEVAQEAFAFEDSLFDCDEQNWLDLRRLKDVKSAAAWCHGAVGIGLARLDLDPRLSDPYTRNSLRAAAAATWQLGLGWNHCVCHGDLGAWELLDAAIAAGEGPPGASREDLLELVLTSLEDNGPVSGITREVFSPSLMPGLGGIAYQLLRAHPASELPSVLTPGNAPASRDATKSRSRNFELVTN